MAEGKMSSGDGKLADPKLLKKIEGLELQLSHVTIAREQHARQEREASGRKEDEQHLSELASLLNQNEDK